ncbi:MAG: BTAD domain-containing putative transcriptional regulator [Gemmatimonadales bacterium]
MTALRSSVVQLQLLGPVRVSRPDGPVTGPLVTQPRRLAILAYLILARPRGLHSRDTLIALLWPEASQAQGRHALRNALHAIRRALGDDLIQTAGDDFVGVDFERLSCDALAFEDDVAAERFGAALARHEDELLHGFHVSDAPGFERWLDGQRERLRELAVVAAWAHADALRRRGDSTNSLIAARRAHSFAPEDEVSFRRLLGVIAGTGDRAAVLRAYREFADRLHEEYGVAPAAETRALLDRLGEPQRRGAAAAPDGPAPAAPAAVASSAPPENEHAPDIAAPASPPRRRARAAMAATVAVPLLALLLFLRPTQVAVPAADDPIVAASQRRAVTLGDGLAPRYRADTALYQRYLRAEALLQGDRYRPSRDSFQAIVDGAPLYAPAWAGLSTAISLSGFSEMPPTDAMALSRAAAQRALALDSTLVHAKSSMIAYDLAGRWDLAAAKRGLDAALAEHPDDQQLTELLATWHRWRGEFDETIALRRKVYALDPLKPGYAQSVGGNLYLAHRCAEAADVLQRVTMEFRTAPDARANLYRAYRCLGRMDDAAAALAGQLREEGDTVLANLLASPMSPARRDSMLSKVIHVQLDRALERRRHGWEPSRMPAIKYAELQNADSTLMWLDSMYAERSMSLHTVPFDPAFDFLHGDRRFNAFVGRLPWHPRVQWASVSSRTSER